MAEVKCWAKVLGDCSGGQTREHYISKNIWTNPMVTVEGLWAEPRTLRVESLTVRSLCKTHNEGLSELDSMAGDVFRRLGEVWKRYNYRTRWPRIHSNLKRESFDGLALERWALKYLIGMATLLKTNRWHPNSTPPFGTAASCRQGRVWLGTVNVSKRVIHSITTWR
jgi:hypothetical protein